MPEVLDQRQDQLRRDRRGLARSCCSAGAQIGLRRPSRYRRRSSAIHRLVDVDIGQATAPTTSRQTARLSLWSLTADVFAVADAEGLDRFAIWRQSWAGRSRGPRPVRRSGQLDRDLRSVGCNPSPRTRRRPTSGSRPSGAAGRARWFDLFKIGMGETVDREFPTLGAGRVRADPQARSPHARPSGWPTDTQRTSERSRPRAPHGGRVGGRGQRRREGGCDDCDGQSLQSPGRREHAPRSALTVPVARAFLDRWFAWTRS